MKDNGLGDSSTFYSYHPIVTAAYYILVIGITMFSMSPFFLAVTFIFSWGYSAILKGPGELKQNAVITLVIVITMALINTLFTHNGQTVLFYINGNRITLEAFVYGIAAALMLSSVMIWFKSFNVLMSSDKIIYLFGKLAPVIGLVISMIFRFIPLLRHRFEEISMGQKCMGRGEIKGLIPRARQVTKEVSILIAWSLEASIESADSMSSRGYGLRGRSSFHLFEITGRDVAALVYMAITGGLVIAGSFFGLTTMSFYPQIMLPEFGIWEGAVLFAFVMLLAFPVVIDIYGEYRWRKSDLTI